MFKIIEGDLVGGTMKLTPDGILIKKANEERTILWGNLTKLSLVDSQLVDKGDSAAGAILGGLFGGALGAAAGAGIGAVTRSCTFHVLGDDLNFIASGSRVLFDQINKGLTRKNLIGETKIEL